MSIVTSINRRFDRNFSQKILKNVLFLTFLASFNSAQAEEMISPPDTDFRPALNTNIRFNFEERIGSTFVINRNQHSNKVEGTILKGPSRTKGLFGNKALNFNTPYGLVSVEDTIFTNNKLTLSTWINTEEIKTSTLISSGESNGWSYSGPTINHDLPSNDDSDDSGTLSLTIEDPLPEPRELSLTIEDPLPEQRFEESGEVLNTVAPPSYNPGENFYLRVLKSNNGYPQIVFGVRIDHSHFTVYSRRLTNFTTNNWHHVGATYDGSSLDIFFNGEKVGSRKMNRAGYLRVVGEPLFLGATVLNGHYFRPPPCFEDSDGNTICASAVSDDSDELLIDDNNMSEVPVNSALYFPYQNIFSGIMDEVKIESRVRPVRFFKRHYENGIKRLRRHCVPGRDPLCATLNSTPKRWK